VLFNLLINESTLVYVLSQVPETILLVGITKVIVMVLAVGLQTIGHDIKKYQ
jgi:hypothetical protein